MGRASRTKANARAQRQLRRVSIYNPTTNRSETHETSISDEGVRDWVANRRRLASKGYPDRIPEIDTPRFRGWKRGGPVSTADRQGAVVMGPASGRLIVSLRADCPEGTQKVFFEELTGGVLTATFRYEHRPDSVYSVKPHEGSTADGLIDDLLPLLLDWYRKHDVPVDLIRPEDLLALVA